MTEFIVEYVEHKSRAFVIDARDGVDAFTRSVKRLKALHGDAFTIKAIEPTKREVLG